ncbi:Hypp8336 [Branchiostoma lanceolatum]|uniref:Hypp8336 protein n=1 Tax=Branchiostoma lanceolatum TaxID=7740 RepID=A0A8J9Z6I9_BRALA|nr:Hypp8336 [Branchiostoma lanceolatum]
MSKINNTMDDGDEAASHKHFNHLLQTYREEILPDVVENWDSVKKSMRSMDHMHCQLHALIGFATYSDEALKKLEDLWRKTLEQLDGSAARIPECRTLYLKQG